MVQQIFRAESSKWMIRNLKLIIFSAVLAGAFWWLYNSSHDVFFIIFAVLTAVSGLIAFISGLFTRPKLVITGGQVQFGKVTFSFSDVIDVKHKKDEYTFFLSSRRRMIVKLAEFSNADKKAIDKIFAEGCLKHLSDEGAKEKIAKASEVSDLEFSFRAKRSTVFFTFYLLILIFGVFSMISCLLMLALGEVGDTVTLVILALVIILCVALIAYVTEKRITKDVFEFKDDKFTLWHKGKTKFSFAREDVQGIGINPQGQAYIIFRIRDRKKRIRLHLFPFSRKDGKLMKEKIRSIFFLPDENKQNPLNIDPFKFKI